mgnify:CR=1 FL=1
MTRPRREAAVKAFQVIWGEDSGESSPHVSDENAESSKWSCSNREYERDESESSEEDSEHEEHNSQYMSRDGRKEWFSHP